MTTRCWTSVVRTLLHILLVSFSSEETLVGPPWASPAKPSFRLLQQIDMSFNRSNSAPPCTTKDHSFTQNGTARNGLTNNRFKWTRLVVLPDASFDRRELAIINQAMWNLRQHIPCVYFGMYPSFARPSGDYIRIRKGRRNGCNADVGRLGGEQSMNLQSPGCVNVGTVMHEFIHSLGFHHEHARHDRDDFVTINWGNILPAFRSDFHKMSARETSANGVPYNYNSIMHYASDTFTRNGRPTIVAKNGQRIGDNRHLQQTDIIKLKRMYNC